MDEQLQHYYEHSYYNQRESVEMIANSLGQVRQFIGVGSVGSNSDEHLPDFRNSYEQSNTEAEDSHNTRNKLTEMLENCLQKSKELISQNESRKKQTSYFTLNQSEHQPQQQQQQPLSQSKVGNEHLDDLFQQSMQRSRQVLERSMRQTHKTNINSVHQDSNESVKENTRPENSRQEEYDLPATKVQKKYEDIQKPLPPLPPTFMNIEYENSISYQGMVIQNQQDFIKTGYGLLFDRTSGDVLYQGEWHNDSFHGKGFLNNFALEVTQCECDPTNFSNLSQIWRHYQGDFTDGLMNGKGQLVLLDGSVFQGNFINGVIDGFGMYMKDKQVLVGIWSQNQLAQQMSSTFYQQQ